MFDTLIHGGRLVTPAGVDHKSITIQDGTIAAITAPGEAVTAREEIDAIYQMCDA